jgi:hypothetical protein
MRARETNRHHGSKLHARVHGLFRKKRHVALACDEEFLPKFVSIFIRILDWKKNTHKAPTLTMLRQVSASTPGEEGATN